MSNWISILNGNSGAIIAIATIVLVIITGIYAWLTHKTVEEMQKARQVEYLEKQLEKFYYPLQDFLKNNIILRKNGNIGEEHEELIVRNYVYQIDVRYKHPLYKDIITHKYLAKKETFDFTELHLWDILKRDRDDNKEKIQNYHTFMALIENDIDELLNKLNKLAD
jgi:uncharacterized protein YoxC